MIRHPFIAAFGIAVAFAVAACSGGAGSAAPSSAATDAPASLPAASEPAAGVCSASTDAGTIAVTIEGFAFKPAAVTAKVGDIIGFTNKDSAPHTATLDDNGCTTDDIAKDGAGALVFSAPGSYPFHCRIHPDMKGPFEISG